MKRFLALFCVLALGIVLAGCDKCGDWYKHPASPKSCNDNAPR